MTNDNHSDRVETVFHSFRDSPVPDGPSAELMNDTVNRLQSLTIPNNVPQRPRRNFMFNAARYRGVVAACTLVIASASWIGLINQTGSIAFADVKQQLAKMRNVRYVESRLVEQPSDDIEALQELERKGVKPAEGRIINTSSNAHQPRIIKVLGRHLQRVETLNAWGVVDSIQISDLKTGKYVTLSPKEKKFVDLDTGVTLELDSGKKSEEKVKAAPDADLFARISELPAEATTRLPARTIGGKQVIGFYYEQTTPTKGGTVTWERTYWIDPATKLPVRVEISFHSTDKRIGRSDWVQSNFVFDEALAADQFSTEPPEGYTRETQKIMGIKID